LATSKRFTSGCRCNKGNDRDRRGPCQFGAPGPVWTPLTPASYGEDDVENF